VNEAVRRYGLTVADFAATDLTIEMLYLVEAKSAVMEELRHLNLRLHGAKAAAEEQALSDTLTGLCNRRALDLGLGALVQQGQTFGLMHLDLDYFKQVNDTHGHAAGDAVLRQVALVLREETRASDLVARVGGTSLCWCFPACRTSRAWARSPRALSNASVIPLILRAKLAGCRPQSA
jgi:GGDEF domain-containing protein